MCLVLVCDEPERVVATFQAPGRCPYCGGGVVAAAASAVWWWCRPRAAAAGVFLFLVHFFAVS